MRDAQLTEGEAGRRSAAASSWASAASPGRRLTDSVTTRQPGTWCGCTLRCSQRWLANGASASAGSSASGSTPAGRVKRGDAVELGSWGSGAKRAVRVVLENLAELGLDDLREVRGPSAFT